jgi:hypothetical protein
VAIALNTLADALLEMNEDDPPARAEAAYEEAYRIRLNAFGAAHALTLATLRDLGNIRGLRSRTHGDRARIEMAADLFRLLIANSSNDARYRHESAPYARTALARMYARNGMAAEAREQLRLASELTRTWREDDRCEFTNVEASEVAALIGDPVTQREGQMPDMGGMTACTTPDMTPASAPSGVAPR